MKKYIVKLKVDNEETLVSGSPMTLSEVIERSMGKRDIDDYRIVKAVVTEENVAGDLKVVMFNENNNWSECYELLAPVQLVSELRTHDHILETLAKLTFLYDLTPDRIIHIMEYPVEKGIVLKEDTLFNMFKWCGERGEAQMATPVKNMGHNPNA